jgi:hypothetical protein
MVEHAMRVGKTRRAYVYPATHYASKDTDENLPCMGERIRLKKDFDISRFSPEAQAILKGLKKYGMFVADNGLDWTIRWRPIHEFRPCTKSSAESRVRRSRWWKPPGATNSQSNQQLAQPAPRAKARRDCERPSMEASNPATHRNGTDAPYGSNEIDCRMMDGWEPPRIRFSSTSGWSCNPLIPLFGGFGRADSPGLTTTAVEPTQTIL